MNDASSGTQTASSQSRRPPFEDPDFRVLIEKLPVMVNVLDKDLTIVASSDLFLEATMRNRDELSGMNMLDAFPDDPSDEDSTGSAELRESLERVRRDRKPDWMAVQKYPIERPVAEGGGFELRYWSPLNAPICNERGELLYIVNVVQDVTEFVTSATRGADGGKEPAQLHDDLELMKAEILGRSSDLLERTRGLQAASDAKNEFLSRMSHELRTPLTAILGFGELLSVSELDDEQHDWVSTVLRASKHLAGLVDEILDISRIESGEMSLSISPVSIDDVVQDALALMRPLAERQGLRIKISSAGRRGYVMADNRRLEQVFINLISNAIKYNRPNGLVELSIAESDGDLLVSVSDTGMGIDPADIEKLFVPFERLDAANAGVEGTGLGLALSKSIVEAMGGQLIVESTVGTGTTFTVKLRRTEPDAIVETGAKDDLILESRRYSSPRKLLYIEDTVVNATLVEQFLRRRPSVRVMPVMLGRLGIDVAREHHPDMILLDLHLPDMNGAEVLAELYAVDALREIPVVILTADATQRQRDEVMKLGAREYLTKPIGVSQLLETVDRYLDHE